MRINLDGGHLQGGGRGSPKLKIRRNKDLTKSSNPDVGKGGRET